MKKIDFCFCLDDVCCNLVYLNFKVLKLQPRIREDVRIRSGYLDVGG